VTALRFVMTPGSSVVALDQRYRGHAGL